MDNKETSIIQEHDRKFLLALLGPETEKFNITRHICSVLDDTTPQVHRIIAMYELQIALLSCRGLAFDKPDGDFIIKVNKNFIRSASCAITLRIAGSEIFGQNIFKRKGERFRPAGLKPNSSIIQSFLLPTRWRQTLDALPPRLLGRAIELSRGNALLLFKVVNLSFRASRTSLSNNSGPTISWARMILCETKGYVDKTRHNKPDSVQAEFQIEMAVNTLKKYTADFEPVSIMLYLLQSKHQIFWPRKAAYSKLITNLCDLIRDKSSLLQLVSDHNYMAEILRDSDFRVPSIAVPFPVPSPDVDREPLPSYLNFMSPKYK